MGRILDILENAVKPAHPWGVPRNADVEITNICQLKCDMCPRNSFENKRKAGNMTQEQFSRVLNELRDIPELSFSANGEATLHPEFMEFFRMAVRAGKKLTISTNGVGFSKFSDDELIEIIKGFYSIGISMDSPYKEKYEKMRKGASFEELITAIKRMMGLSNESKTTIIFYLVCRDQKKKELEDMINLAEELGIKKITVAKFVPYKGALIEPKRAITLQDVKYLKKFGAKKGIKIIFYFYPNFPPAKRLVGCNWPWHYVCITYEGAVTPCVLIKNPARINLGNIFEKNFMSIWHGEKFNEFRKNIKRGLFPSICRETQCWFLDRK